MTANKPATKSDNLIIRNLTAQALTIKVVERYDAAHLKDLPHSERKTSFFTGWTGNETSPTYGELKGKARNYVREEVDIRIEPFTTHRTSGPTFERQHGQLLRLTIHGDDAGKWRINTPAPSAASQRLSPLGPKPGYDYHAIYLPSSTLTIFESSKPKCWMKHFRDDVFLSALSIPGTHNAHTCYKALPSVRCQAVGVTEQLENGIRFLDIRVQPANPSDSDDDTLNLVHGVFPISLTGPKRFWGVLDEMEEFLKENPSETLVLSLKREGPGNATDQQLSTILKDHYANDSAKWYTEPRIPRLGEVRGKIVLLRRFVLADRLMQEWEGRGWCLDAENWDHNSTDCTHGDVRVQDYCEVMEASGIEKKIGFCCDHFERAAKEISPIPGITTDLLNPAPPNQLYLNFTTGSNFWKRGCWPDKIAERLNPAMLAFLCEKHDAGDRGVKGPGQSFEGDGGLGIVVCDWVGKDGDWDLVKIILAMNGRLLLRQRERD